MAKQQAAVQQEMTPEEKIEEQQAEARHAIRMHMHNQRQHTAQLKSRLEGLRREIDNALNEIERGHSERLNSLGIIQGQGLEIDREIALIHLNAEWLKEMQRIHPISE